LYCEIDVVLSKPDHNPNTNNIYFQIGSVEDELEEGEPQTAMPLLPSFSPTDLAVSL
jgi:hypothetical protein